MKRYNRRFSIRKLSIVLGLTFLILPALIYFPNKGTTDMDIWLEWTTHVNRWGPLNAFNIINTNHDYQSTDYPPLSFVNLWLALKMAAVGNISWVIGIKVVILVYYLTTWVTLTYLSASIQKRSIGKSVVIPFLLFFGGLYFVVNSAALSFLDITFAPYVVLSLALFARRRHLLSGMSLALGILMKWIPALLLPVFLFYFINKQDQRYRINYLPIIKFFGGVGLVMGLLILGFRLDHVSLFSLVEALRRTFDRPYMSALSLNFNWIITYLNLLLFPGMYGGIKDGMKIIIDYHHPFRMISLVIFLSIVITILKTFLRKKKDMSSLLQTSLMISWSYFIWYWGVHENHLFLTVLAALCLATVNTNRNNIRQYLWLSAIGLIQILIFYGFPIRGSTIPFPHNLRIIWGIDLTVLLAIFHVSIYLVYLKNYLRTPSPRPKEKLIPYRLVSRSNQKIHSK